MLAVETKEVSRLFRSGSGEVQALENVSLSVKKGELFGLLGPNGAGKTTIIKILTTLLAPSSGNAFIHGMDIISDARAIRPLISMVSGGENSGYGLLTVKENLWMFSQFYGMPGKIANARIDELLKRVGLYDRVNTRCSELSTGLRQRMNIVRGFLTDPLVLFLDEPTLGLDVSSARDLRRLIREWLAEDEERVVFLTTHYLAEAEELCDRVAIMDKGTVIACDSPKALRQRYNKGAEVTVLVSGEGRHINLEDMSGLKEISSRKEIEQRRYFDATLDSLEALPAFISLLDGAGYRIHELKDRDPSLEEVFVRIIDGEIGFSEAIMGVADNDDSVKKQGH